MAYTPAELKELEERRSGRPAPAVKTPQVTNVTLTPVVSTQQRVGAGPTTSANIATGRQPSELEGFIGELFDRVTDLEDDGGGAVVTDATTTAKGIIQLAGDLAGTADAPTVPSLDDKIPLTQKGAAGGVASLGGDGKVPSGQLPAAAAPAAPAGVWTADKSGYISWSFDPMHFTAAQNLGGNSFAGRMQVVRLPLAGTKSITRAHVAITGAPTGLTAGQSWAALYDKNGAKIAVTADLSTVWNTVGVKALPFLGGPYELADDCYVGLFAAGSTGPQMPLASNMPFGSSIFPHNSGHTGPAFRVSVTGPGLTTPDTAPATLGSVATHYLGWWVAVS